MRSIKLQKVSLTNSQLPDNFEFDYRKELLQIIEVAPEGMTVSQMQSALKVQKALNNVSSEGTLYLEDADWEYLKGRVAANKWRLIAPEIIDFSNAITDAKECEAPHLARTATGD